MIPTCLGEYESFGENLKLGEDSRAMTKCGAQYSQTWEGINLFFNDGGMEKRRKWRGKGAKRVIKESLGSL